MNETMETMKKNVVFTLFVMVLIAAVCTLVKAQVSIGSETVPAANSGINLQLEGTKGGLLLPQVEITGLMALPKDFPVETDLDVVVGLLVYNKTAATDATTGASIPIGVYYWSGSATGWKLLAEVG